MAQIGWKLVALMLLLLQPGYSQINQVPGTSQTTFYLDAASDCDGRIREVGMSTVNIFGGSANTGNKRTSCTLTLQTDNIREPHKFKIQFLEVRINNPGVLFYVYDGEFNGRIIWAFSQQQQKPNNLDFDFSTGQLITFRLTRGERDFDFSIRIVVTPVPGQLVTFRLTRGERDFDFSIRVVVTPVPGDVARCTYENEYGCDEYGYNYRLLDTKDIIGIIGGAFGLVVLIVIIVVICCYRKQKGISKKWTETKLGHVNTAASLHTLNGKVASDKATGPWTSESSKADFASIRRSPNLPRAKIGKSRLTDMDKSFTDSHASLPAKRPLPPPSHVSSNPRGTSSRGRRSRFDRESDHYSDASYSDRSYSEKNYSEKNYSDRNYRPPTYREAIRNDQSESSADESSFVQANDDHPQKVFVERVIEPRVKPKSKKTSPMLQRAPPPPEEDETYDSIDPKTRANKALISKETEMEESDTDNESEISEEESEEESTEEEEEEDKPDNVEYSTPDKSRKSKTNNKSKQPPASQKRGAFVPFPQSQPQQFTGPQYPGYPPPGVHQPQPRYGYPQGQGQPYPQGQPPYNPQGQPYIPQGQSFPQQPAQPYQHPYHQANFSVPLGPQGQGPPTNNPQPSYHGNPGSQPQREQSHKPKRDQSQVNPGHIPVYSYLVNRGYQPVDGRLSPLSTTTGGSNMSGDRNMLGEESDYSANIGAGVEVLRRK